MPRPKGSKNRSAHKIFKEMVEKQVAKLGVDFLDQWARDNPGEFYKLASRLIPQARELSGPGGMPIQSEQLPVDRVPRAGSFDEWFDTKLGGNSEVEEVVEEEEAGEEAVSEDYLGQPNGLYVN